MPTPFTSLPSHVHSKKCSICKQQMTTRGGSWIKVRPTSFFVCHQCRETAAGLKLLTRFHHSSLKSAAQA